MKNLQIKGSVFGIFTSVLPSKEVAQPDAPTMKLVLIAHFLVFEFFPLFKLGKAALHLYF